MFLRFFFAALALLSSVPVSAGPECRVADVLRIAALAYQGVEKFTDAVRLEAQVPGAPVHHEVLEYAFDRTQQYLRMPSLYEIRVFGGRITVNVDGKTDRSLRRPRTGTLQEAVDVAFGTQGPPLVPASLLLREADPQERMQVFRFRLLGKLRESGCRVLGRGKERLHEIQLDAANGTVRARFSATAGWLLEWVATVRTEDGGKVGATARFAPRPGVGPPSIPKAIREGSTDVATLSDLEPKVVVDRDRLVLQKLDGSRVALRDLRGSLVVLEFWATWCVPCRATLPAAIDLMTWSRTSRMKAHVFLVNTSEDFRSLDEARLRIGRYFEASKLTAPTLVDLDGSTHRAFGGGLPLTVVIGPDGEVVEQHGGFQPDLGERLRALIRKSGSK